MQSDAALIIRKKNNQRSKMIAAIGLIMTILYDCKQNITKS